MTDKAKKRWIRLRNATMRGCTIAVAVLLSFFAIMSIVTASTGQTEQGMTFSSMLTLILFSLTIAYAQELFAITALPSPARWALNFVVIGIAFFFVVLRSGLLVVTASSFYVIGMLIYVLVYAIIAAVCLIVHRLLRRRNPPAPASGSEYTSRFS